MIYYISYNIECAGGELYIQYMAELDYVCANAELLILWSVFPLLFVWHLCIK